MQGRRPDRTAHTRDDDDRGARRRLLRQAHAALAGAAEATAVVGLSRVALSGVTVHRGLVTAVAHHLPADPLGHGEGWHDDVAGDLEVVTRHLSVRVTGWWRPVTPMAAAGDPLPVDPGNPRTTLLALDVAAASIGAHDGAGRVLVLEDDVRAWLASRQGEGAP